MKKNLFIIITIVIAAAVVAYIVISILPVPTEIESNGDPVNANIVLTSPRPGELISSPLLIEGKARGNWFFEASFPVILTNWDGLIIAESYAQAQDEWMTENFVPFKATLEFETPELYKNGSLILQKDNPSGLPENDAAYEITVQFQ